MSTAREWEKQEREKYRELWNKGYKPSQCAKPLADYIKTLINGSGCSCLDIGCGDGTTFHDLRRAGVQITGVDISLQGYYENLPERAFVDDVFEAPAWDMPMFKDGQFVFSFSTDVMEHLPEEMVGPAIDEIYRVTAGRMFHVIATFPDKRNNVDLHQTVRPIQWWRDIFHRHNPRGIDTLIMSRREFSALYSAQWINFQKDIFPTL